MEFEECEKTASLLSRLHIILIVIIINQWFIIFLHIVAATYICVEITEIWLFLKHVAVFRAKQLRPSKQNSGFCLLKHAYWENKNFKNYEKHYKKKEDSNKSHLHNVFAISVRGYDVVDVNYNFFT